ncbi:hypothetical protein SAMN05660653_02191 [Desulfonatronum thiosulfatophilum]|uniref:Uncharacterized protein n=1 Tax=Desulfonatronum thiosulfatophilum TaxID=617002 RepID=A0A1G6DJ40_9BACT|nr:hypothetical protein SAMN05660653_02191 [Desulfonatronum thiosulfatophilum]
MLQEYDRNMTFLLHCDTAISAGTFAVLTCKFKLLAAVANTARLCHWNFMSM